MIGGAQAMDSGPDDQVFDVFGYRHRAGLLGWN
jgi:hypothetical protein